VNATALELSLVVPVYNERENLAPLVDEIATALAGGGGGGPGANGC